MPLIDFSYKSFIITYDVFISLFISPSTKIFSFSHPMNSTKFRLAEFCRYLIEETGSSFIFGTTTALTKNLFDNENNIIVKNIMALRKGADYAEYTLLFNTLLLISRAMRMKRKFAIILCNFICSYISTKRNGVLFAFKSAIFNLISNFLNTLF